MTRSTTLPDRLVAVGLCGAGALLGGLAVLRDLGLVAWLPAIGLLATGAALLSAAAPGEWRPRRLRLLPGLVALLVVAAGVLPVTGLLTRPPGWELGGGRVVAVQGDVLVGIDGDGVTARDPDTGDELWQLPGDQALLEERGAAVLRGTTVTGVDEHSGRQRWSAEVGANAELVTASDGVVVVALVDVDGAKAGAVALDLATGDEKWRFADGIASLCRLGSSDICDAAISPWVVQVLEDAGADGRDRALVRSVATGTVVARTDRIDLGFQVVGDHLVSFDSDALVGTPLRDDVRAWTQDRHDASYIDLPIERELVVDAGDVVEVLDTSTGTTTTQRPPDEWRIDDRAGGTWFLVSDGDRQGAWRAGTDVVVGLPASEDVDSLAARGELLVRVADQDDFLGRPHSVLTVVDGDRVRTLRLKGQESEAEIVGDALILGGDDGRVIPLDDLR